MEPQSIHKLSVPRAGFFEPPRSSKPIHTTGYEISPAFIAMVRELAFSGVASENPYHHLREFEQLCTCLSISGMAQETLKWKLFPFSLVGGAKHWYTSVSGNVGGDWVRLRDSFCLTFFLFPRVIAHRKEIIMFQQLEEETLGAA